ncbi:MAG TPA: transcription antitermination factor NusB [Proteobacteria bacterium]|nr:transcription antitermination factor NusB [Pseudomonadota bacterium]
MGIRRKARESVLQILYEMDLTGLGAEKAMAAFCSSFKIPEQAHDFCLRLVTGVETHREQIDTLVNEHSEHWRLNRMSRVDRNILRLAAFELLYCDDIPPKVTINEAVELGKKFGTEDSGPFINGILDAIYDAKIKKLIAGS